MATQATPLSAFLAPRHWPTWTGIGLLFLTAWLPLRLRLGTGALLGHLSWLLAQQRRYITRVNIRLCFPGLSPAEQEQLARQVFVENGIGLVETATGWFRPPRHFAAMVDFPSSARLQAAVERGQGVLLQGAHYSTLDFSANLLSLYCPFAVTYRAHGNPLFNAFMLRGRLRNCNGVFDRNDVRGALRHLRQGKVLWYAPDQDYGPEQAVYAPFFGNRAACITAGSRFAAFNHSAVFVVSHRRDNSSRRYILEAEPVTADYPSGDDRRDVTLINTLIEHEIRKAPAQYMWMHKRFKTQPGGKPESPYVFIRTPNRRLGPDKEAQLMQGATALDDTGMRHLLASGLQLRLFPGLAGGLRKKHPALRLDTLSKHLRAAGITCVTVDSIFRFPHRQRTGVTLHVPPGTRLARSSHAIPPAMLADFLAALHGCGCSMAQDPADIVLAGDYGLGIDNPLGLRRQPGTATLAWRVDDIAVCCGHLGFGPAEQASFNRHYLGASPVFDRQALAAMLDAAGPITAPDREARHDA